MSQITIYYTVFVNASLDVIDSHYNTFTSKKAAFFLNAYVCNLYPADFLKWAYSLFMFETFQFSFRDMVVRSWSANSIEPGQTA